MRLLLIRHGESVDNVAGLYAGSRDSSLTNHGVLQARRLGAHLAARSSVVGPVKRIFVSNLQRAVRTAEAVAETQAGLDPSGETVGVVQLPELREKDFGSDEGRRFGSRGADPAQKTAGWLEPESKESMKARVERFIDAHLVPTVLRGFHSDVNHSLAIVAHGIILNVLLRCLLARFGPEELTRLTRPTDTPGKMEWLASWSNTGYLEADLRLRITAPPAAAEPRPAATPANSRPMLGSVVPRQGSRDNAVAATDARQAEAPTLEILMTVTTVNSTEHLQGLKKTRGGIGSAAFDQKQKTMDSFFTRPAKASPPAKAPSPVKAPLPVKDITPMESPQPVDAPPPVEVAQQVTRPIKATEATEPSEQVKPPPPAEALQTVKAPQPTEATRPAKAPQVLKVTRPPTEISVTANAAEPAKASQPAKVFRPHKVKRPIKKAKVFKKVRFVLPVED
ncbi:putative phosphoglycerate mutase family protein [Diaporthe ampelina]|uniref:Putative phosphoglycerate mutase family protein n=1 Tax=Diaporthe ampelina TaxID=1214573 RepID=A0A0G2FVB0_9PEZI|nr:putative phosphoglycerate mutase family protein [Diaporthe ampelina]